MKRKRNFNFISKTTTGHNSRYPNLVISFTYMRLRIFFFQINLINKFVDLIYYSGLVNLNKLSIY